MIGKGLVRKLVAGLIVAASGFVAIVALGATIFYALLMVVPGLAAAAITFALFTLVALIVIVVFIKGDGHLRHDDEDDEPEGLAARLFHMVRSRPIIGTAAALAGGWVFLRNPALLTLLASAFGDRNHNDRGRRRRRY